ncbi:MAG: triose-phosphate isomerase [Lactobacillaceae bacterium]|jgi:triosephosphate isomerase|nr:triose-phosphate isomerase [Lactobacillaceae bacterium]
MRKPFIVANWKMNFLHDDAINYIQKLILGTIDIHNTEIGVAAQDIFLKELSDSTLNTNIKIVAQNAHWKNEGSYTGETSPMALSDLGVDYVMLGHFERRQLFNETNETVNRKLRNALNNNLDVIVDVEELEQVEPVLKFITEEQMARISIAFEPTYAIGTGKAASAQGAQDVAKAIRDIVRENYGSNVSEGLRVLYGGSVDINNELDFVLQEDIDGVLVGKASLNVDNFIKMIQKLSNL